MAAEIVNLASYRADKAGLLRKGECQPNPPGLSVLLDRKEQRRADHRGDTRHHTEGRCLPEMWLGSAPASVCNVSPNGIMVKSDIEAPPGTRLLLSVAGCMPMSARVVWNRDGLVGLEVPFGSMSLRA